MRKISTYISYLPKRPIALVIGAALAVTLTASAVAGFGPDRPTKVYNGPGTTGFDQPTFNSFTNVPGIGDERQFYVGKYEGENSYHPTLTQLRGGDEITMRVYIHNGADPKYNANGSGIARNVNVKVDLPQNQVVKNAETRATITSSNTQPLSIWSSVDLAGDSGSNFALDYVEGSATIDDQAGTRAISDSLVTTGVNIGDLRGCFEYAVAIEYKVKIKAPDYEIKKQVAVPGEPWKEEVQRDVNEQTSWLISFENKGSVNLNHVTIVDDLPPYNTIVPGSLQLFDSNFPNGLTVGADAVQNNGRQINLDIGTYAPGGGAHIKFKTTIDSNIPDLECNRYRFQNVAYATPEGFSPVNDSAYVVVEGECDEDDSFIRCEALNASIIDKATRTIEVAADVEKSEDVTITGYEFNWGDGKTDQSDSNVARHSFDKDGKYKIVATVKYNEGGVAKSVNCETTVDFVAGTVTPPTTPDKTTPGTLPVTGPGEILASLFGTGSLAGATHMWVNSRRSLKAALKV